MKIHPPAILNNHLTLISIIKVKLTVDEITEISQHYEDAVGYDLKTNQSISHNNSYINLVGQEGHDYLHMEWEYDREMEDFFRLRAYFIFKNLKAVHIEFTAREEYYYDHYEDFENLITFEYSKLDFKASLRNIVQQIQFIHL